jgi:hypothetical protein
MRTTVKQVENALEVIMNLFYLIEVDASKPAHISRYVKMADPSFKTLTELLAEMRTTG